MADAMNEMPAHGRIGISSVSRGLPVRLETVWPRAVRASERGNLS